MATVELVGRLLVSLAVVLGLMWVVARRMRKGGGVFSAKARSARVIEVLDRASLSRGASVAVVRVNDQAFVLGVAEHGVSILGETDLDAALAAKDSGSPRRAAAAPAAAPAAPSAAQLAAAQATVAAATAAARATHAATGAHAAPRTSALAGSALSPQTWRQTVESLRDLTSRT